MSVKFVNFLKSRIIFILVLLFLYVYKQTFHISHVLAHISKRKSCFNVKSSTYYFHVKTKILEHFQICISVPLSDVPRFVRAIAHLERLDLITTGNTSSKCIYIIDNESMYVINWWIQMYHIGWSRLR